MIHLKTTDKSVDQAVKDLEAATQKHGFGVMEDHDLKGTLKEKGVEFPHACHVLEICNPHHAANILGMDMRISMALPCRVSVYEHDGQTLIGTFLPTQMMGVFGENDEMMAIAKEVEEVILAIIDDAV